MEQHEDLAVGGRQHLGLASLVDLLTILLGRAELTVGPSFNLLPLLGDLSTVHCAISVLVLLKGGELRQLLLLA